MTNSPNSTNPTCSPEYAGKRARLMFGCYRRSDAADPDTYCAAVTMVLSRYSAEVVTAIPYSGLPSRKTEGGWSGLPDVADVKEACEAEAAKQARMAKYRAMGKTEFKRLPAPRNNSPGAWANVLVIPTDHRYARLVEITKNMDPRMWRVDAREGYGIWVALSLIEEKAAELQRFKGFTDAELREMYPPREAPATAEAAE
jgi:hypothetical protein